jgi:hypothetical protein
LSETHAVAAPDKRCGLGLVTGFAGVELAFFAHFPTFGGRAGIFRVELSERLPDQHRFAPVPHKVVLVEGFVVVKVVTAGVGTGIKSEPLMGGTLLREILMTMVAIVSWETQTHCSGPRGLMFRMTRYAESCVKLFDTCRIARICKLGLGMRILNLLELSSMAFDTANLKVRCSREVLLVTGSAGELDLVVTVSGLTWKENLLRATHACHPLSQGGTRGHRE